MEWTKPNGGMDEKNMEGIKVFLFTKTNVRTKPQIRNMSDQKKYQLTEIHLLIQ